ncbi:hypothetical protein BaRGS_00037618 [Batillaria attramentaria]|uniref:Uncharacterized protein n=1 Tax=Batillaria attramentaria TaxID=370345 RepID=A0ABD0J8F2_9CAEN
MADKGRDNEAVGGSVSVSGAGQCQSAENDQFKEGHCGMQEDEDGVDTNCLRGKAALRACWPECEQEDPDVQSDNFNRSRTKVAVVGS